MYLKIDLVEDIEPDPLAYDPDGLIFVDRFRLRLSFHSKSYNLSRMQ